ncbi:Beta-galactosidase C-terminal domain [Bacteroides sp. CR5/BHMF/2]|nr:Beta-galactosidase C-terminal domain [Bacteroides sp. CR5/BHMF/2]
MTAKIIQTVLAQQGIRPLAISENKMVEITEVKGRSRYLYLINFSEQSANVYIEGTMTDILSKEKYNKEIIMAPMDIKVVEINR